MLKIPIEFLLPMHIRENEYPQNFAKSHINKNEDLLIIVFFDFSQVVFEMKQIADLEINYSM